MPTHDIVCYECEALWDDVVCSFKKRAELGGIPCPHCKRPCDVSWHNNQSPSVLVSGVPFQVAGIVGEFSSYHELEKAADSQGKRIMESDEKAAVQDANRQASADYAKALGYSSKETYGEARKTAGETMVHRARQKYVERQRQRYGEGYDLSTKSRKWRPAGLNQTAK